MDTRSLESQVKVLREELEQLRDELAHAKESRISGARRLFFWPLLAALVAFTGTSAADLVTFNGGEPALASEINDNFAQLQAWIEQKVGTVGTDDVEITGDVTIGDPDRPDLDKTYLKLSPSGVFNIRGGNSSSNLHIESSAEDGDTDTGGWVLINYTNHKRTRFGGDVSLDGGNGGSGGKKLTAGEIAATTLSGNPEFTGAPKFANAFQLKGGEGPVCLFAETCPNGWNDVGRGGFLADDDGASCPYTVGGSVGVDNWRYCHSRICCVGTY